MEDNKLDLLRKIKENYNISFLITNYHLKNKKRRNYNFYLLILLMI